VKESHSKKTLLGIRTPKFDLFFSKWEISIHGRTQNKLKRNFNFFDIQDSSNHKLQLNYQLEKKKGKSPNAKVSI
jgi:hypothetical protein